MSASKYIIALILGTSLGFQAASACAANDNIKALNSIAIEANSSIITYRDIDRMVYELKSHVANQNIPDAQLIQAAKTRLLERALLADAARQQGLKVTQAGIDDEIQQRAQKINSTPDALYATAAAHGYTRHAYRMEVAKDILIEHMMSNLNNDIHISDAQINEAMKQGNLPKAEPYTVYTIRRVILKTDKQENMPALEQRMQQIFGAIKKGSDFAAIAQRYSQEPEATHGGLHDNITDYMLPERIENLLHTLKPGDLIAPQQSGTSWQVIQLVSKRVENNPDKMQREAVRRQLVRQAQQENHAQFVAQLQQGAVIRGE